LTDAEEIKKYNEQNRSRMSEDDERARQNPYAFLPGLRDRLTYTGKANLLNRLKAKGYKGAALQSHFLGAYESATTCCRTIRSR
jgi:hypothetical protein